MRAISRWIFFTGFLFILIPLVRLVFFSMTPLQPGSAESFLVELNKGQGPNDLARNLVSQQIISDGKEFLWLGRLTRKWGHIKAGEYRVSPGMTPLAVLNTFTSGVSAAHPLTVREGENMYEIAEDLSSKGLTTREIFLTLCRDPAFIASLGFFGENLPSTLEGYLFPDTYFFNRTLKAEDMLRSMVKHFFQFWSKAEDEKTAALKMTRHEVITLASMIEKETGATEERPMISSVFHNRLKVHMKLQSDPTTIYGMWENYHGKIHRSDLIAKNPYNTYFIPALPIGPIANPSREAIDAALNPVQSRYFFFVSHNNGTHEFTENYQQHNRAVAKFQLDPKARQGKSWRDRLKKPGQEDHSKMNQKKQ